MTIQRLALWTRLTSRRVGVRLLLFEIRSEYLVTYSQGLSYFIRVPNLCGCPRHLLRALRLGGNSNSG